jgi:hypothetical protein
MNRKKELSLPDEIISGDVMNSPRRVQLVTRKKMEEKNIVSPDLSTMQMTKVNNKTFTFKRI